MEVSSSDIAEVCDWQTGRTVIQRNEYMFTNQVMCDVHFLIKSPDSAPVKISSHKYVLISSSSVFNAMLCGELKEGDCIEIVDIDSATFKIMLRYALFHFSV